QRHDAAAARAILDSLVRTRERSDDPLRANAELKLLLLDSRGSGSPDAFQDWCHLIRKYPHVVTETGLPLSSVACYQAVRAAPSGKAFEELRDVMVFQMQTAPSILPRRLLEDIAGRAKTEGHYSEEKIRALQAVWETQERARGLLRTVPRDKLARPDALLL